MSEGSGSQPDVNALFASAQQEGLLSKASTQALAVVDIGQQIQAALGLPAIQVLSSEIYLVTKLIDDSGSILNAGNEQVVRDGFNLVLDSLMGTKQRDSILAHCRYLNGEVLFPYCLLEQAVRLDRNNYYPTGGTPLYDQTVVVLGSVLAKTLELREAGIPTKTTTLIMTDGHDEHSRRFQDPESVAPIVKDMLRSEDHIIIAMGIDDGYTDFRDIFRRMGLDDRWILTPANTPSEIRRCFNLVSRTSVQASQSAKSHSEVAQGGAGWTN